MSREKMIELLIEFIEAVEGVKVYPSEFKDYTDKELEKDLDWYDYLMDK